ncbi:MAG: glycerophosphodiester phosphodiesterase [Anaerolineae bacterium]|nr:glycerophosphodiester phosphodiesterase [Anaerolineae bacterium]
MLPMQDIYQGRTLVLGHRGASGSAPMNTLPAFDLALTQGADGIELDTHLTKDGVLIVLHDFTVDHTTDGNGYARDLTLAEIKRLDAGHKFSESFRGTRIPTLDEVFESVGGKLLINVEIKSEGQDTDGVEQSLADCIRRHGLQSSIIVSSFNSYALQRFRQILPEVPIGYLYAPDWMFWPEVMDAIPHEARHPHHSVIDVAYMKSAREHGWRVNTWTVNDPQEARRLRDLGVDAIITDYPARMIEALRG